jgi:cation diffusion facilitator CzcD-associated flavoprotein CzcO
MAQKPAKRVAIIGLGPAGAIAIDAFAQEEAFDVIRVFERREAAGGCWYVIPGPAPFS